MKLRKRLSLVGMVLLLPLSLLSQIVGVKGASTGSIANDYVRANHASSGQNFASNKTMVTGSFKGTIDLDPSTTSTVSAINQGDWDIYLQSLWLDETFNWALAIGGGGEDKGVKVIQTNNRVYLTGIFSETVDFDPNGSGYLLSAVGSTDIFLACYDLNGNFVWAQAFGDKGEDEVFSMDINTYDKKIYLTGTFMGKVDFIPGPGVFQKTSNGGRDCFVSAYDLTTGLFQWVHTYGGRNDDFARDISVNTWGPDGELVITGEFSGLVDFMPYSGTYYLSTSNSAHAIYALRMDEWGNFIWVKKFDTPTNSGGNFSFGYTTVMDVEGDVYCAGVFDQTFDFDPNAGQFLQTPIASSRNGYLVKLTSAGNFSWVRQFYATSTDVIPLDLDLSRQFGQVYAIGTFIGSGDFDPLGNGNGGEIVSNGGGWNTFILRYRDNGNFGWVKQPDPGPGGESDGFGIEVYDHACASIITFAGQHIGSPIDLDPEATVYNVNNNHGGIHGYNGSWGDDPCSNRIANPNANAALGRIAIHPNPAQESTTVTIEGIDAEDNYHIVLQGMDGRIHYDLDMTEDHRNLDVSALSAGVYMIHISSGERTYSERFIKED